MSRRRLLALLALLPALAACGRKGPLEHPEDEKKREDERKRGRQ